MAKTGGFTTSDPEVKKLWDEKFFRDSKKLSFFEKFSGKNQESIVHVKEELTKKKGLQIKFFLRKKLEGAGVTGNQILEGKEEQLNTHDDSVTLERYRHGVRDDGELDRQAVFFSIEEEAEMALQDWMSEKIDQNHFDALKASPTKIFYLDSSELFQGSTNEASVITALDATKSKLTLNFITQVKTWALTGGNRAYIPLRPIMIDGKPHLVLLVHPDVLADLKLTSAWQQAQREAMERGKKNPLFTGAEAVWDGVIVYAHENVESNTDGGSGGNVPYAKCHLLGKQALICGWGKRPQVKYGKFDYEEEHGWAIGVTMKVKKPVFENKDFGSLACYFAHTNISGK